MAVEFLLRCGCSEHVDVHDSGSAGGDDDGTADAPPDHDARRPLDLIMARKGVAEGIRGDGPGLLIGHSGQRRPPHVGPEQKGGQIRAQAIHDVIPRQDADRERASSWTRGARIRLESHHPSRPNTSKVATTLATTTVAKAVGGFGFALSTMTWREALISVVRWLSTYLILESLPACTHLLHQLREARIPVQRTKQRIALGEKRVVNEPAVDGALQPSQGFVLAAKDRLRLRHDVRVLEVAPDLALEIGGCQGLRSRGVVAKRVPENCCQCG